MRTKVSMLPTGTVLTEHFSGFFLGRFFMHDAQYIIVNSIKAIVFDVGGVLRDFYTPIYIANQNILKEIGVNLTLKTVETITDEIEGEYAREIPKMPTEKKAPFFIKHILEKLGIKYRRNYDGLIRDTSRRTLKKLGHLEIRLYPDVLPVVSKLKKNFSIVTLANIHDLRTHKKFLKISGMINHFEFHANSIELKLRKPDRRIFMYVIRKLRLKPSEIAMVGDMPYVDILGGKRVGMMTVLLNRKGIKYKLNKDVKPDYEIRSLYELFGIKEIKEQMKISRS